MKTAAHPLALVIALGSSACGSTVSVPPEPYEEDEGVVIPEASTEAAWTVIEDTVGSDWPRTVAVGNGGRIWEHSEMWVHTYERDGTLVGEHSWGGPDGVFGYGFSVASDDEGALVTNGIVIGEELSDYGIAVRKLVPPGG